MKRLLSILLSICLLMTPLTSAFTAYAADEDSGSSTEVITEDATTEDNETENVADEELPEASGETVGEDPTEIEDKYSETGTEYDLENEEAEPAKEPATPPEKDNSPGEDDSEIYGNESFDDENAEQLQGEYVIDEIIVKFLEPDEVDDPEQLQREINKVEKIGVVDILGVYVIRVEEFEDDPNTVLNQFKNNKYVDYVEPNYVMEPELVPDDPNYRTHQSVLLTALNAQEGWDILTGSSAPVIAVVDTGVANHRDMTPLLPGYSAVESLSPNLDKKGHGTGVAGVIGMIGNNGIGGAGINWSATILPVKVDTSTTTLTTSNLAKGIIWAADNGAQIINLSCGTKVNSSTLKKAIDYAYNKGCLIIAGTGNDGIEGILYPARYDNVLAVGAASSATGRAGFSNYGAGINVTAAGGYYTTGASGGYASMSGTSFATPQVSALASMVWSLNPELTNDEVWALIEEGTQADTYNDLVGHGMIDIGATLKLALASTGAVDLEEPDAPQSETPQEAWTAPTITLDGFAEMTLEYGQEYIEAGYKAEDCKLEDITSAVTVTNKIDIWTPGIYTVTYDVVDSQGETARAVRTVKVNEEPEIKIPVTAPIIAANGSNPIVLHQTSSTPYTEQSARAVDYDGTDISDLVEITGSINREVAGTYTITYSVTSPLSGITSTTTRDVRIVAPTEIKDPRTQYGISGMAKKGGRVTHKGFVANEAGFIDIEVASLSANMTISVQLVNSDTGEVMLIDTFTSAGMKQYKILEGKYNLLVTVTAASGIGKYSIKLLMPETAEMIYEEEEVPLFVPMPQIAPIGSNPIILHIGGTPYTEQGARATDFNGANLSAKVEIIGKPDTSVAGTYTITYRVTNEWGFTAETTRDVRILDPNDETTILEPEVPLNTDYVVQKGDSLWSIAQTVYKDGTRWADIYEWNKELIGPNPNILRVGQVLKLKLR